MSIAEEVEFMPHLNSFVHVPTMTILDYAMNRFGEDRKHAFCFKLDRFGPVVSGRERSHVLAVSIFSCGRDEFFERMRDHIEQRFMRVD